MNDKHHTIEHPLESVLDIEAGTTIIPHSEHVPVVSEESQPPEELYDSKDNEIDGQIQEIYDAAMSAFEAQIEESELVEGKYKARNGEVAVQFLNTALSAAREKAGMKQHKDKIRVAKNKLQGPSTVNNNLVVADRNDLLKQLLKDQ